FSDGPRAIVFDGTGDGGRPGGAVPADFARRPACKNVEETEDTTMASFRAKHRRAVMKKRDGVVTLNLVSLTDFFTILLVFLLANSTETEVLTMNSSIKLPESASAQRPEDRMVISVGSDYVVVNGKRVVDVAALNENQTGLLVGLEKELRDEGQRRGDVPEKG